MSPKNNGRRICRKAYRKCYEFLYEFLGGHLPILGILYTSNSNDYSDFLMEKNLIK